MVQSAAHKHHGGLTCGLHGRSATQGFYFERKGEQLKLFPAVWRHTFTCSIVLIRAGKHTKICVHVRTGENCNRAWPAGSIAPPNACKVPLIETKFGGVVVLILKNISPFFEKFFSNYRDEEEEPVVRMSRGPHNAEARPSMMRKLLSIMGILSVIFDFIRY